MSRPQHSRTASGPSWWSVIGPASGGAHRSRRALTTLAVAAAVLPAAAAAARPSVIPASGGRATSFEITFPARAVALDLQITGPGRCATLDPLYLSIRRARRGDFRFGPRVPGARPRRDGTRFRRWCRGSYRASVVSSAEFDPMNVDVVGDGQFTVR